MCKIIALKKFQVFLFVMEFSENKTKGIMVFVQNLQHYSIAVDKENN